MINKIKIYLKKRKILTNQEPIIGKVIKYYPKKEVTIIKLLTKITKGDEIIFFNKNNIEENFVQITPDIYHNRKLIKKTRPGMEVGIKTLKKTRPEMIILKN